MILEVSRSIVFHIFTSIEIKVMIIIAIKDVIRMISDRFIFLHKVEWFPL